MSKLTKRANVKQVSTSKSSTPQASVTTASVPMIGYKASLLLLLTLILTSYLPYVLWKNQLDKLWLIILGSIASGLSLPVGEYFLDAKKAINKWFFIKSIIYIVLMAILLALAYYGEAFIV